jgi:hypothetical protein
VFWIGVALCLATSANAITKEQLQQLIKPIDGDPVEISTRVIGANFPFNVCKAVTAAIRLVDGSIQAVCVTGETFRVFGMREVGEVAMRCSALPGLC